MKRKCPSIFLKTSQCCTTLPVPMWPALSRTCCTAHIRFWTISHTAWTWHHVISVCDSLSRKCIKAVDWGLMSRPQWCQQQPQEFLHWRSISWTIPTLWSSVNVMNYIPQLCKTTGKITLFVLTFLRSINPFTENMHTYLKKIKYLFNVRCVNCSQFLPNLQCEHETNFAKLLISTTPQGITLSSSKYFTFNPAFGKPRGWWSNGGGCGI